MTVAATGFASLMRLAGRENPNFVRIETEHQP